MSSLSLNPLSAGFERCLSSISLCSVPFPCKRVMERVGELQIHTSSGLHPLFILKYPSFYTDYLDFLPSLQASRVVSYSMCLLSSVPRVSFFKKKSPLLCFCPSWCLIKKMDRDICSVFLLWPDNPPLLRLFTRAPVKPSSSFPPPFLSQTATKKMWHLYPS